MEYQANISVYEYAVSRERTRGKIEVGALKGGGYEQLKENKNKSREHFYGWKRRILSTVEYEQAFFS